MPLFRRRKPDSQPATVQASAAKIDRRNLNIPRTQQRAGEWQREISRWINRGPGVCGNYLDTISDKINRASTVFKFQNSNGMWEPLTDDRILPLCHGTMMSYKNPYQTPSQLMARHARLLASMGECWFINLTEVNNNVSHYIAHPNEMKEWQEATTFRPGQVVWFNPFSKVRHVLFFGGPDGTAFDQVTHSWIGEDDNPSEPTSELRRAMPDIRAYMSQRKRGTADARSRLAMSDMLSFGVGSEVYVSEDENDPDNGTPMAILDYLDIANLEDRTPYDEHSPVATQVPFPMMGEAPTLVQVGRDIDPQLVAAENQTLLALSHALRCPTRWLIDGPVSAKRNENDDVLNALIDDCIVPQAERAFDDFNQIYFRKVLQYLLDLNKIHTIRADRIMAGIDPNSVRPRPDQGPLVFAAWDRGLASSAAVESVTQMDLLDRPAGMTDWEFWQFTKLLSTPQGGSGVGTGDTTGGGNNTAGLAPSAPQQAISARASGSPPFQSTYDKWVLSHRSTSQS